MRRPRNSSHGTRRTIVIGALALLLLAPGLVAAQGVTVNASVSGTAAPNRTVLGSVSIDIQDGSTLQSVTWTQTFGATAKITSRPNNGRRIKLAPAWAYRNHLIEVLREPPVTAAQLPENVPLPPGEFPGGLQDRFQLVGMSPFALEEGGLVRIRVTVVTSSGTYTDDVEIEVHLPFAPTAGLRNVPVGVPVVLYGKTQASYNWTMPMRPGGSTAALTAPGSQHPFFTPDRVGNYEVRVTDLATATPVTLMIYAGTFRGVITGIAADGRPIADNDCTVCHGPSNIAPDKFTPWRLTGHAEIFTNNLNTNSHYGTACFSCHFVGFDLDADNLGADEAAGYQAFLGSGLLGQTSPNNYTNFVAQFPQLAKKANVQCENCHGPQEQGDDVNSAAHGPLMPAGEPRVNLSADVCAVCHGEPLRHARFQQWQLSGHANYELAIDEGTNNNCARCHSANGFLEWLPILLGDAPGDPLDNITVTWTEDEVHPQTCATCHDPHAVGTTTGVSTDATVRISGDTPDLIAGFKVIGAGNGAMCMTCHNTRRGLRNDAQPFDDPSRAPHPGAQTDVLMGENAYLVNVGVRGRHSLIEDTCVNCHMEQTPPPAVLSYQLGGTNHTFFARPEICNNCHTGIEVTNLQHAFEAIIEEVAEDIGQAILDNMAEQIAMGKTIKLGSAATITNIAQVAEIELTESRGRQAINVTLNTGAQVGPIGMNSVDVVGATTVAFYDVTGDELPKAFWNWALVHADGSKGAHNPTFVLTVLDAARDAVGGQGTTRLTLADLQVD